MNLLRNFATVGMATMASRVLGFVRDILLAALLGTGLVNEAYVAAFRLPNLFRRLLAEGAFNSAFVPLFAKSLESGGTDAARLFARDVLAGLLMVLLVLTALIEIGMSYAMFLQVPGFAENAEKFELTVELGRIMFPYIAFMSLLAMLGGILNSFGRFAAAAFAPVMLNVVLIVALVAIGLLGYANTKTAGFILAAGVFAGGIAQLVLVIVDLKRIGFSVPFGRPRWTADVKRLVQLMVPGLIAGGITQLNIWIGTIIASFSVGAVSFLYYADRIYQLPLGVVGIAIGVALLPNLSRQLRSGNMADVFHTQNRALEFSLVLTLPAAAALLVIAEPIIGVLFQRGAFTATDTSETAAALAAFATGLPAFVLIKVFSPGFFAREDTKTPMWFAGIGMVVNVAGSLALFPVYKHVGIAIATALAGWVNAGLLGATLWRRGHFAADRLLVKRVLLILLASVVMGTAVWLMARGLSGWLTAPALAVRAGALAAVVVAGALLFFALCQATGAVDLKRYAAMLVNRRKRDGSD